jgi:hypothetical protein
MHAPTATTPLATHGSASLLKTLAWLLLLGASACALGAAPALMPDSYSWVRHTISESAAQGVAGAWLARLGFLLFGLAVLWLAAGNVANWGRWGSVLHGAFAVGMLANATFSHRPWEAGAHFDETEDVLHSAAATTVGFAFTIGVVAVIVARRLRGARLHPLDLLSVTVAIVLPLGMALWGGDAGLLQRAMFVVSYLWYATEVRANAVGDAQRPNAAAALAKASVQRWEEMPYSTPVRTITMWLAGET